MRGAKLQFALLALVWGASFLLIKVGLTGLSPAQVVLGRLLFGAAALAVVVVATGTRLPRFGVLWGHMTVVAVVLCVAPFLLFAWAERHVSSGLASICNATTPLMTTLVAMAALPQEHPTRMRVLGLLTGMGGVVLVLGPWHGLGGAALGPAACLLAAACYGCAFVYLRRFVAPHGQPAVAVATLQVGIAAVIMLALTPALGTTPVHLSVPVVLSVGALGVVGTGLAYVWNTNVVAAWGATNASTVTYLTPVVGVALGVVVLAEPVAWNQPAGALLVLAGIAISRARPEKRAGRAELTGRTRSAPGSSTAPVR